MIYILADLCLHKILKVIKSYLDVIETEFDIFHLDIKLQNLFLLLLFLQ